MGMSTTTFGAVVIQNVVALLRRCSVRTAIVHGSMEMIDDLELKKTLSEIKWTPRATFFWLSCWFSASSRDELVLKSRGDARELEVDRLLDQEYWT
jgi:hypothetical protein